MTNFFTGRLATISNFLGSQHMPSHFLANLFSWSYWTDQNLTPSSPFELFFWLIVAIVLLALFGWREILKRQNKKIPVFRAAVNEVSSLFLLTLVVALLYSFFRNQGIAFASSRLVILVSFLIILGWSGTLAWRLKFRLPTKKQTHLEKERFFRYLPKKKVRSN